MVGERVFLIVSVVLVVMAIGLYFFEDSVLLQNVVQTPPRVIRVHFDSREFSALKNSPYGLGGCGWYGTNTPPTGSPITRYSGTINGLIDQTHYYNSPIGVNELACGGTCPPGQTCTYAILAGTLTDPRRATPCMCFPDYFLTATGYPGSVSTAGKNPCRNIASTGITCGGTCPPQQHCGNNLGSEGYPCLCLQD